MANQANINYTIPLRTRPTLRTARSEWLAAWLAGEMPDTALLEQQGFQSGQYYAVVIYRPGEDALKALNGAQMAPLVHVEAARRGISGPVLAYENSAVLFHPVEDPQQTTRLKRKTEEIRQQLRARLHDAEIVCGVGRPARGMENLRQSFCEGEDAVNMSSKLHRTERATFFGNSSLYNLLLSLKNPSELQRFCMTWLADLIDYDLEQHSDLLETLQTYFANNGNTALTARTQDPPQYAGLLIEPHCRDHAPGPGRCRCAAESASSTEGARTPHSRRGTNPVIF
jgi:sugar diacid utilization regulator